MPKNVFCIVEGHGEETAVPELLRRVAISVGCFDLTVLQPYRVPRSSMLKSDGYLEKVIKLGCSRLESHGSDGAILLCLDLDDDEEEIILASLTDRISPVSANFTQIILLPVREYEAWFLASAEGFRGHSRVKPDAIYANDPELIRDAKGAFEKHVLLDGEIYRETVDQVRFTALMDLEMAKRSKSFLRSFQHLATFCQ